MNAFLSKLEKLHNLLGKGDVFTEAMKTFRDRRFFWGTQFGYFRFIWYSNSILSNLIERMRLCEK